MTQYAFIVSIGSYENSEITKVAYAEDDARRMRSAFINLGYLSDHITLLLNEEATHDHIKYHLNSIIGNTQPEDQVIIYLNGHGCCHNGKNSFLCWDSSIKASPKNVISMEHLMSKVAECKAEKVVLFLDCCHAGLRFPENTKSPTSNFTPSELREFFCRQKYKIAFCSCAEDEESFTSKTLQHSFWTYYLLEALTGAVPELLDSGALLNGARLQEYLHHNVPRHVKQEYDEIQTPQFLCNAGRFLIADLTEALKLKAQLNSDALTPLSFNLEAKESYGIRELEGFDEDTNRIPDEIDRSNDSLYSQYGRKEVEAQYEKIYKIVRELGYKIRDIKHSITIEAGLVGTPNFDCDIWMTQSTENAYEGELHTRIKIKCIKCITDSPHRIFLKENFGLVTIEADVGMDLREIATIVEELPNISNLDLCPFLKRCDFIATDEALVVSVLPRSTCFSSSKKNCLEVLEAARTLVLKLQLVGIDLAKGVPARPVEHPKWARLRLPPANR